jgi:hypothetical protein
MRGAVVFVLLFAAACKPSPSAGCKKLIACATALLPGNHPDLAAAYGPEGTCWRDRENAKLCAERCDAAIEGLKVDPKFDATPECAR